MTSKNFLDLQMMKSQHICKITQAEFGYFFCVFQGLVQGRIGNRDLFKKAVFIHPAVDLILRVSNGLCFIVQQPVLYVMDIQVVEQQGAVFTQAFHQCAHGIVVLPAGVEIAKGGKKIKSEIEIVDPGGQPHVVLVKMQVMDDG